MFIGCSKNPKYEANLATVQKLVQLHCEEDLEGQLALLSKEMEYITPIYGSEPGNYDTYAAMMEGYHQGFEDILYTPDIWLPGTNMEGKVDGGVRTFGTWTGTNSITGKKANLKGFSYFKFDDEGKVIKQSDFFDIGGMMQAVGPKTPVLVQLKVKNGKKQAMIDLLNSPDGLQATRDYDGCMSLEAFFNDDTDTYYIYGNWASYDHYQKYLDWRFNGDESRMAERVIALCVGGEEGLLPLFPNSDYASF